MAIIIKDIEVPSCCDECEFKYYLHGEGQTYCKFTDERIDYSESKNNTCPIVSVNDIIESLSSNVYVSISTFAFIFAISRSFSISSSRTNIHPHRSNYRSFISAML